MGKHISILSQPMAKFNGQTRPLTQRGSSSSPMWIATNEIIFERGHGSDVFIAAQNVIKRSEFLSNLSENNTDYFYSQDASKIASIKDFKTLCIMNYDGSNYKEFDFQDEFITYPKWSPDNQCVLFVVKESMGQSVEELWAISIERAYKWLVASNTNRSAGGYLEPINHFSWSPFL